MALRASAARLNNAAITLRSAACSSGSTSKQQFSTASQPSVTDQMIDYATRQCKGKHDQAIDVLRSGLSMHGDAGLDSARLLLSIAGVEADRSNWREVLSCSSRAAAALKGVQQADAADAQLLSSLLTVKALLVQGHDAEAQQEAARALTAAKAGPGPSSAAYARALAFRASSSHATGDLDGAQAAADELSGLVGQQGPAAAAAARWALGAWSHKQGDAQAAEAHYTAAVEAAAQGKEALKSAVAPLEGDSTLSEIEASALLGRAMFATSSRQWDAAEELLSQALKAAEGVSTDNHPRVTPILLQLGYIYSRTSKITYAEGLYRECAKILRMDPNKRYGSTEGEAAAGPYMHASVGAALAWRYHQLLSALPNRGGEASTWGKLAADLWTQQQAGAPAIETVLGSSEHLKGKDQGGSGMVVDVALRRGLRL